MATRQPPEIDLMEWDVAQQLSQVSQEDYNGNAWTASLKMNLPFSCATLGLATEEPLLCVVWLFP
jgi:hypothetical protein